MHISVYRWPSKNYFQWYQMEKLEETLRNNNIYMKLSLTVGALRPKLLPNYFIFSSYNSIYWGQMRIKNALEFQIYQIRNNVIITSIIFYLDKCPYLENYQINKWPELYRTGEHSGGNRDKKRCCFHSELDYKMNSRLKQRWYVYKNIKRKYLKFQNYIFTPPRNRGGVIFFTAVCLCVCVCMSVSVCVSGFLVNKIPTKRMHRFGHGFAKWLL